VYHEMDSTQHSQCFSTASFVTNTMRSPSGFVTKLVLPGGINSGL
jgi:hypothetical protein